jgi:ferredoxin-NADP reductase
MLAKKYLSRVVSIKNHFEGIYTLEFESLNGKFKYHPGQFLHIAIDPDYDGTGQWPESRCFSMQSNPDEENVSITFAVKGRFTQLMKDKLKIGSEVWLKLPYGDLFTQHHNKINTVFIAGGTGITPFLSLFTHDSFKEYKNPRIYLGFKSKYFNIYDDGLNLVKSCDLKIFYENEKGFIDIDHIFSENGTKSDYFISGPPMMIKTFRQNLSANGVPSSQILTDDWG